MRSKENFRNFYEAAFLQHQLKWLGYKLIFADEFHISFKDSSFYNWSKRIFPAVLEINPDSQIMSFVIAISSTKVEGLMASMGSIIAKSFSLFIYDICEAIQDSETNPEKTWFIFDNTSLHRSKEFSKFVQKKRIKCLTIPPYSPQLNPAEKIIAYIKSKIRECWLASKTLSLNLIRAIVDNMNPDTWDKCIRSSTLEAFKVMKIMKNSEFYSNFRSEDSNI